MGNTFAKEINKDKDNDKNKNKNNNNNESDTINWNSLKTEKINVGGALSNDSKLLLNRLELNLPKNDETEIFSEVDNIFSKYQTVSPEKKEPALSETSPFISSEMYNLLMKPEQSNAQQGGGKIEGDDSSTSATSSSNDDSSSEKKKKKFKKVVHKNKKNFKNKVVESAPEDSSSSSTDSSEVLSTEPSDVLEGTAASNESTEQTKSDELDYVSSSAHEHSESEKPKKKKKAKKEETEVSGGYESTDDYVSSVPASSNETSTIKNLNNNLPHSSINTSEINMITEDY